MADHNIWWDEGIGIWLARMPLWDSVRWTAGDVHPPLYYVCLHIWRSLAGEGEFSLRFLSVILSLLTVPLIYRLGRILGGSETGFLAALLLTISRFSIWWAQEIRMYALAALLATGSLWAAVWLWRNPGATSNTTTTAKWVPWMLYVACTAGSLYTLYLTATVPIVTNLGYLALWLRRRRAGHSTAGVRAWATAQVAAAALFLPWALYALPRMHSWSSDTPFTLSFFVQLYSTILVVGDPLNLETHALLTVGTFLGLGLGIIALIWRFWRGTSHRYSGLVMLIAGLLLPPIVVAVISLPGLRFHFSRPLVPRYLLPLSACYSTLLAWGIVELKRRVPDRPVGCRITAIGTATMAVVAAITGLSSFYPGRVRRDDYATIAEVLRAHRRTDEAVLLYVDRDWPIFVAHYQGERNDLPYGAALSDPDIAEALLLPIWERTAATWLVSTPESLQTDPAQTIPQWLAAHSVLSRTLVSGEVSLTFYTRTPERVEIQEMVVPSYSPPAWIDSDYGLVGASLAQRRYGTGDTVHLGLYWIPPLPMEAKLVLSSGTQQRSFPIPEVTATTNIVRNQVDIPLTPDLDGGSYTVEVTVPEHPPTPVGRFTLVPRAASGNSTLPPGASPVTYRLGKTISLVGYALPQTKINAGETLALTLYWRTEAPQDTRYKVFTHLLGTTYNARTGNFLWGQQDNEPVSGQAATTLWAPGMIIEDPYLIHVDAGAPPGLYAVEVGMYGLIDGVRLAVAGEGDAIRLAEIEVEAVP
ncbi:MAG: hypothetical protein GX601_18270 [Anaerolineales bacterium]|nr:hypothetical protein [Anaerolineales bacterium]